MRYPGWYRKTLLTLPQGIESSPPPVRLLIPASSIRNEHKGILDFFTAKVIAAMALMNVRPKGPGVRPLSSPTYSMANWRYSEKR